MPTRDIDSEEELDALWSRHHAEWRDTAQVTSHWNEARDTEPGLLRFSTSGKWWEILSQNEITLLVSREYEHLLLALTCTDAGPFVSFMRMPHPSGIAVDREKQVVHIASTRNPNQIYDLIPASDSMPRLDVKSDPLLEKPLIPAISRFYPGCLYMHDLAIIDKQLYANAVGNNAIVKLHSDGTHERVWWPKCIETAGEPIFGQNHIQLNSIASGNDLNSSFFSASADVISSRRPGHKNFPVDKRGVIFSGATREPIARGLTRPHSARQHNQKLWVDNSGYGEFGFIQDSKFIPITKLQGWTRGLCFFNNIAFVGTSRVIPRFAQYAPGLDVDSSICGIHALDIQSGEVLGSLTWPSGNQLFAIDWLPQSMSLGFPFISSRPTDREKRLFYAFSRNTSKG